MGIIDQKLGIKKKLHFKLCRLRFQRCSNGPGELIDKMTLSIELGGPKVLAYLAYVRYLLYFKPSISCPSHPLWLVLS